MPTHAAYHKPCLIHAAKWQREFASQQAARVQFTRSASTVDTTVKETRPGTGNKDGIVAVTALGGLWVGAFTRAALHTSSSAPMF
jgi:hypothetical protein